MRKWARVAYQERCGLCGALLESNTPVMEITFPNAKKVLFRCQDCVGAAPPDLPERVNTNEPIETKIARIREIAERTRQEHGREWMPHAND